MRFVLLKTNQSTVYELLIECIQVKVHQILIILLLFSGQIRTQYVFNKSTVDTAAGRCQVLEEEVSQHQRIRPDVQGHLPGQRSHVVGKR